MHGPKAYSSQNITNACHVITKTDYLLVLLYETSIAQVLKQPKGLSPTSYHISSFDPQICLFYRTSGLSNPKPG